MIYKLCGDQSGLCHTQILRAGFSKASASVGKTHRIRPVQPKCRANRVATGPLFACLRVLTFHSQSFLLAVFKAVFGDALVLVVPLLSEI